MELFEVGLLFGWTWGQIIIGFLNSLNVNIQSRYDWPMGNVSYIEGKVMSSSWTVLLKSEKGLKYDNFIWRNVSGL